ncbi:FtsK/SpoIIIE domain-containing protein [uncultured Williamsia sp.]|uniref:FtsK/SpoIIIE domain-containing protein n=1 Tax=uncultured Williamsia sp. TaxID=259311 RepID=UPI00261899EA|nr:FtsK/SpoIIIE domain-containing protein [uncultured Williamsia sp.]
MRLALAVRGVDESLVRVAATTDATATVQDLAFALRDGDPRGSVDTESVTVRLWRDGRPQSTLPPGMALVESGIRSGATLEVVAAPADDLVEGTVRGRSVAMVRVVSGPDGGREFLVPSGVSTVGSAATDHVRVVDPAVGPARMVLNVGETIEIVAGDPIRLGTRTVTRALIRPDDVVGVGGTTFVVLPTHRSGLAGDDSGIEINRSPRVVARFAGMTLRAPEPPKPPQPQRFPLVSMLAPLAMGLVLLAATGSVLSVVFVALSPLLMLGMWLDGRMQESKARRVGAERFTAAAAAFRADLEKHSRVERAVRLSESPSAQDAITAIHRHGPLLWTHRPEHSGYLTVRLGLGECASRTVVELPERGEAEESHWTTLVDLAAEYRTITDVPVVADLRSSGALGVCGPRSLADGVARAVLVQLVGLHSPAEMAVAAVVSEDRVAVWDWLEWLPHMGSVHSPLEGEHAASTPSGCASLIARLDELVRRRRQERDQRGVDRGATSQADTAMPLVAKPVGAVPAIVVLVDDAAPIDRARAIRLAETGPDVGVHLIWVASQLSGLPAACRSFVLVEDAASGSTAGSVRVGTHTFPMETESVGVEAAQDIAILLAPLVDVGVAADDRTDLPSSLHLLSLTGDGIATDPSAVVARWEATDSVIDRSGRRRRRSVATGLRAPVGSSGADTFWLDLRRDGPHALLGGTTGSGKSEFLQSWILGMAAEHSPDRVSFLFVDYKGGTAFADCVRLPHTVGLVTDLSAHLVDRALASLRAELRFREHLLNVKRVKDHRTLEESGDPDTPPSLVVVVDEFAALAHDVPEFVDGMVDLAARGRSLGLHVILATQRPAGVIKENLRANANLRIALRMADADDSVDILNAPDAAHFPAHVPGRAAAKIGNAPLRSFQGGYSGGWSAGRGSTAPVDITPLALGDGRPWAPARSDDVVDDDLGAPDMVLVVDTVIAAAERLGIPSPRKPWLPELPPACDVRELAADLPGSYSIGVLDLPEQQRQPVAVYTPEKDGTMLVLGTGGSGKSAALRTVAVSATLAEPLGVEIYGIDCGSGGLRMLEPLPTVGAVIALDDEERIGRLLRRVWALIESRIAAFGTAVSGLAEHRAAVPSSTERRVLLLVDQIGAFRDAYEVSTTAPFVDLLTRIAANGRAVGVHVIASADRPNAVPPALAAVVTHRITLRLADETAYTLAGVRPGALDSSAPPGRGIVDGVEMQFATAGGSQDVGRQSTALREIVDGLDVSAPAPGVERLSEMIWLDELPTESAGEAVVGVRDLDLQPATISPSGVLMVTGPPGSGRSTALTTIVAAARRARPGLKTILIAPFRTPLAGSDVWDAVAVGDEALVERADMFIAAAESAPAGDLLAVVESATSIRGAAESELARVLKVLVDRDHGVIGEAEVSTWNSAFTIGPIFKAARRGLLLHPGDLDGDSLFGTPVRRPQTGPMIPGRGYLVERGSATRVQLAIVGN